MVVARLPHSFPIGSCCCCHTIFPLLLAAMLVIVPPSFDAFELALFASNGCYSHDVMMREAGQEFEAMLQNGVIKDSNKQVSGATVSSRNSTYRINWLQIFLYDFGFRGQLPRPAHWGGLVVDKSRKGDNQLFMDHGSKLLWEMTVPLDHNRPWNLKGAQFLFEVLRRNQHICEHFVVSAKFQNFLSEQRTDLVVVDHFLQECFTMAASLLNASATVQFSNWPIADGYIGSLNIPAPPSAYPKTSTAFSAREMHSFAVRLRNSLFHAVISGVRALQGRMIERFFTSVGYPKVRLRQAEAAHLFYASRAEFLAEPVRPINNRVKHFGCAYCRSPGDYFAPISAPITVKRTEPVTANCAKFGSVCPHDYLNWTSLKRQTEHPSGTVPLINCSLSAAMLERLCKSKHQNSKGVPKLGTGGQKHNKLPQNSDQFVTIRRQFPLFNWAELEQRPFVLVSFGSIAKVEFMPEALLRLFLQAFSAFPTLLFVWPTNSDPGGITSALPSNVRLHRWAPIKTLLAHPNLRYSILHGGVNTVNEALIYGAKPILGIPLQGDQPSNLQRLVDLRMAELVDIGGVWGGLLKAKMALLEQNYDEYARRASKVSAMVNSYRNGLGEGQQSFWLRWAANKRFLKRRAHRLFAFFYRSSAEHFMLAELGAVMALLVAICAILSK